MSTVLVVEDSLCTREVMMKILRREGYEVIGASSGREAIEAVHHYVPDLVLLDMMMPEMDGMTVLATLRQEPNLKQLPVIVLSALSDERQIHKARELGASDYLIKSRFSYDELLDTVGQHVKH